jgi:hypothetical protein
MTCFNCLSFLRVKLQGELSLISSSVLASSSEIEEQPCRPLATRALMLGL